MQKKNRNYIFCLITIIFFSSLVQIEAKSSAFVMTSESICGRDVLHEYRHKASGLKVIWIENEDPNMSFTLGVKTPTTDDTGVNHIIEHTIFTGSKAYPSSTLFFDASSKYPNLFMNAMTSSDMTMFPFATSHKASFNALLPIYLDSILNPNMLENPYSFYEEAFHYNPLTKQYGGVVYNEMKGASTDSSRQVFRAIRQGLYEGTHYANDSGGDPSVIPDLTYERFVDTYKNFYYPSNMMIVLYGDLSINSVFETIDGYFKNFALSDKVVDINVAPLLDTSKKTFYFNNAGDEGYLIKSFVIEKDLTSKEMLEMDLWVSSYLVDDQSYFIKTLKEKGISKVQIIKDDHMKYPSYSVVMMGIHKDKMDDYESILDETLQELNHAPINLEIEKDIIAKNQLLACREDESTMRGIEISQTILDAWAHDKAHDYYFKDRAYINEIEKISTDYKEMVLKSPSMTIYLLPKEAQDKQSASLLEKDKENWKQLVEQIGKWQKETKHLPLPDVSLKEFVVKEVLPYQVKTEDKVQYILTQSNGSLKRTSLYIPTSYIKQEDLPSLFLYSTFLNKAASERTPFEEVVDVDILAVDKDRLYPYLKVSVLSSKDQNIIEIFDAINKELLSKDDKWYQDQIQSFMNRFKEQFSNDILGTLKLLNNAGQSGYKRYLFEKHYPLYVHCNKIRRSGETAYIEEIKKMSQNIALVEGVTIGIQGDKAFNKDHLKKYQSYFKEHTVKKLEKEEYSFIKSANLNIYYKNTPVDYLVLSYDKGQDALEGEDYVMASYVTNHYLRPLIRAEQGAYGSSMIAGYPSSLLLYTYRDPDFLSSVNHITQISQVLRKSLDEEALKVARMDALSQLQDQLNFIGNPLEKGGYIEKMILMDLKPEELLKMQKEIINCSLKDLDEKLSLLPYLLENGQMGICTGKSNIRSSKEVNIFRMK